MTARNDRIAIIGLGAGGLATAVYSYLGTHPDLCLPKEPTHFFSRAENYAKGIGWYEGLFRPSGMEMKCGELANDYLRSSRAPALIAKTYPEARLFAVVGDPLLSVRVHYLEALRHQVISPKTSLAYFLKQNPELLDKLKYGRQLSRYFGYYSHSDLMVLLVDEVVKDPLVVTQRLFGHLGLDRSFVPLALKHLSIKDEDDEKKDGFIKRFFKYSRKIIIKTYTKILHYFKPPVSEVEAITILAKRVPLDPELEKLLKEYFKEDVTLLSSLLRRDLNSEWGI